jgi:hypothetical protein
MKLPEQFLSSNFYVYDSDDWLLQMSSCNRITTMKAIRINFHMEARIHTHRPHRSRDKASPDAHQALMVLVTGLSFGPKLLT